MSGKDTFCAATGVAAGVATALTGIGAPLTITAQLATTAGCVALLKDNGVKPSEGTDHQAIAQGKSKDKDTYVAGR